MSSVRPLVDKQTCPVGHLWLIRSQCMALPSHAFYMCMSYFAHCNILEGKHFDLVFPRGRSWQKDSSAHDLFGRWEKHQWGVGWWYREWKVANKEYIIEPVVTRHLELNPKRKPWTWCKTYTSEINSTLISLFWELLGMGVIPPLSSTLCKRAEWHSID